MDSEVEYNLNKFADGTELCAVVDMLKTRNGLVDCQPSAPGSHTATKGGMQSAGKPGSAHQREHLGTCATPVPSCAFTQGEHTK